MSTSFLPRAVSCLALLVSIAAFAQAPNKPIPTQIPGQNAILLGAAWYPEQWPESRWEEDLRLMEAADLKVVRIAEFAWSRMEPSEGHYDFDWLERAINLAGKHHIVSVLGTPTATPPAWLARKYPDTLRIEANGQRVMHGNRAHASASSPRYRESVSYTHLDVYKRQTPTSPCHFWCRATAMESSGTMIPAAASTTGSRIISTSVPTSRM